MGPGSSWKYRVGTWRKDMANVERVGGGGGGWEGVWWEGVSARSGGLAASV